MTDKPAMTGAEFQREVGDDPEKWAARFLAAYASSDAIHTDAVWLEFATQWFSDAMDAARKAKPPPIIEET
jgi:hypothetical protein